MLRRTILVAALAAVCGTTDAAWGQNLTRTKEFFAMREANREARLAAIRRQVKRPQVEPRDLEQIARVNASRMPEPWTQHPYGTATAKQYLPAKKLMWPALLQRPEFSRDREAVDHLMALRSSTYTDEGLEHLRIIEELEFHRDAMREKLKAYAPMAVRSRALGNYYAQARRFVEGFSREYEQPVTPAGFFDPSLPDGLAAR